MMGFKLIENTENGLILLEPDVFEDERGFFMESYNNKVFTGFGIDINIVQENHSSSSKNVVRGLHFQWDPPQGKLIRVITGSARFAEVDIRKNSPLFGKHWTGVLSEENKYVLWVPPGFANGFCALTDKCDVEYKCTSLWNKDGEGGLLWNDPDLNIQWGVEEPLLSDKDSKALTLKEWITKGIPF